jgi:hypothetical protein
MPKGGITGFDRGVNLYQPSVKAQRSNPMSSVQQNVIKQKIGQLNLAAELGNISLACKVMVFSRDTFYRYQAAVEAGGVDALIDANRRKPNIKNRVEAETGAAVTAFALEQPAFGQVRVSTNYANAESSFLLLVFVRCGCARIWSRSKTSVSLGKACC